MTNEQRQKIIEILAYRYAEICKANNVYHSSDYNWRRAEQMLKLDNDINGEIFLLHLLEDEKEIKEENKEIIK